MGGRFPGSGGAQASQKRAKWRPDKDKDPHKTSGYGEAQDQLKSKHDGGGQETRNGGKTPLGTGRDRACG